ncbi:MAG: AraC family transcriptional regulator [Myxococcales bacterium]|nr:AraC family transcriptional regulator [Myxococcales bacterium]
MDALTDVLHEVRLSSAVFCQADVCAPWSVYSRPQPHGIFHAVVQGGCWLQKKGDVPRRLEAGEIVFLPFGHAHTMSDHPETPSVPIEDLVSYGEDREVGTLTIKGDGPRTLILCGRFSFERSETHPLLSSLPEFIHVRQDDPTVREWIGPTLRLLLLEMEHPQPGTETLLTRLADVLLVQGLRSCIENLEVGAGGWLEGLRDPQIARALGHIHRAPHERWSLNVLAQRAGMSRSAFCLRFSELVGVPPFQYLTQWRMHIATRYLREKGESIAKIAHQVGYESEGAFSKAFKRMLGSSPAVYRRKRNASSQEAIEEKTTAVYMPTYEDAPNEMIPIFEGKV